MITAEDEVRIWPQMIPRHLRPPVDFLPMGNEIISVNTGLQWTRRKIAEAFMIPIELLPLPSELPEGKKE